MQIYNPTVTLYIAYGLACWTSMQTVMPNPSRVHFFSCNCKVDSLLIIIIRKNYYLRGLRDYCVKFVEHNIKVLDQATFVLVDL
jgi:hypothetical protein